MDEREVVISVKNLGKSYRIWRDPSARLKAPLMEAIRGSLRPFGVREPKSTDDDGGRMYNRNRYYQDFRALQGVDLELCKGDSVGIIGRNGSGKSTLLQMIAGTLTPSEGSVETKGRVAALLELGAGFNDEFTGRENVYMNGTILGLSRKEIDERFERIVEFANIGEFIDQPIKTYSSGMRVRLAFAVQAEVDPDILIVDEALAVGDIRFTMKCIRRMRELIEKGTTLIFVSHDLSSIVNFCKEVIWIHDGKVIRRGDPRTVTVEYSNFMHYGEFAKPTEGNEEEITNTESLFANASLGRASGASTESLHLETEHFAMPDVMKWVDLTGMEHDGKEGVVFEKAALFCPDHPGNNTLFRGGEKLEVYLLLRANRLIKNPILCCDFYDNKGNLVYGVNSCFVECGMNPIEEGRQYVFKFETDLKLLRNGDYVVLFGCSSGTYLDHAHEYGIAEALTFQVKSERLSQRHHTVSFDGATIVASPVTTLTVA